MATEHKLKTWPRFWDAVASGEKNFDVRRNDRAFQTGDVLVLEKYNPETRRYETEGFEINAKIKSVRKRIAFLLQGGQFGIEPGYCVLGLEDYP
jgi:predicted fused transcriptional regulator/phosphomethylpyrimidine kinase